MSEFSIDFILNRAGERYFGTNASMGLSDRMKLQHNDVNIHFGVANILPQASNFLNVHDQQREQRNLSLPSAPMFDWLHYTRYHPPKLPRSFRASGLGNKRTPGRLPRIPFTPVQLDALEKSYQQSNYLSAEDANKLAESLDLTSTRVKIWYQNRRARERRERREKEGEESYDSTVSSNTSSPPASPSTVELKCAPN